MVITNPSGLSQTCIRNLPSWKAGLFAQFEVSGRASKRFYRLGSGEELPSLSRLADSLGLSDAIRFHGYVPFGRELLDLYCESDLFVLPAVAGEGLPKVLVEAMSQGVPAIATDVGSSRFAQRISEPPSASLLVMPMVIEKNKEDRARHHNAANH